MNSSRREFLIAGTAALAAGAAPAILGATDKAGLGEASRQRRRCFDQRGQGLCAFG